MPPKSILKKTPAPPASPAPPAQKPVDPRHLQVALHHANILEERKRVEAAVLDAILALMEFPSSPTADATRPAAADALHFRESIVCFQPTDYDALIEERNINGRCGYALCPKPKRRAPSTAKKQFVDTEHGVQIVDRKVLEVWCSDDCAKRALYVKVQLKEEPAWMRQGGYGDSIELMVDNVDAHQMSLPLRLKQETASALREDADVAQAWAAQQDALKDLALERGEKPGHPSKANNDIVQAHITERAPSSAPPQAPSLPAQASDHTMAIEGHVPRMDRSRQDSDDDEEDQGDWDKHLPG
ncbi:hypothetical protein ACN47E_002791 [Coniothyrium glycines]